MNRHCIATINLRDKIILLYIILKNKNAHILLHNKYVLVYNLEMSFILVVLQSHTTNRFITISNLLLAT